MELSSLIEAECEVFLICAVVHLSSSSFISVHRNQIPKEEMTFLSIHHQFLLSIKQPCFPDENFRIRGNADNFLKFRNFFATITHLCFLYQTAVLNNEHVIQYLLFWSVRGSDMKKFSPYNPCQFYV
jgi:hypothetical protein